MGFIPKWLVFMCLEVSLDQREAWERINLQNKEDQVYAVVRVFHLWQVFAVTSCQIGTFDLSMDTMFLCIRGSGRLYRFEQAVVIEFLYFS